MFQKEKGNIFHLEKGNVPIRKKKIFQLEKGIHTIFQLEKGVQYSN